MINCYIYLKFVELNKIKAEELLQKGDVKGAVTHLVESHSVGLRHAALNSQRDKAQKKMSAGVSENSMKPELKKDLDKSMDFGKPSFPSWLGSLPHEWTVLQVTEVWEGSESIKMLGFGPAPLIQNLPKLLMVRFSGSNIETLLTHTLRRPAGEVRGSLLAEMNSILEGNRLVNKEFRGNRDQYWKLKQEHHEQLKVYLNT